MYKKATADRHIDFYILDLLLFAASYVTGYLFRFGFQIVSYLSDVILRFALILLLIYLIVAILTRAYKNILHRNKWVELVKVIVQIGITLVIFLLYLYVTKQSEILPRMMFGYMAVTALILIWGARCVCKYLQRRHFHNNPKLSHLLIVAEKKDAAACVASVRKQKFNDFYLCGVIVKTSGEGGPEETASGIYGCPVVCSYEELKDYVLTNVVDEVMLAIDDEEERYGLTEYFLEAGIAVHLLLEGSSFPLPNAVAEYVGGSLVLTSSNNMASSVKLALKRAFDIFGSIFGLIATGILYFFIAPQIKKKAPGPAFFSQPRVGKNGRIFNIYKFRSMYMDAEERKQELMDRNEMQGLMFKAHDDPRIIPGIGERIRRWSLDEFPQFWNVFRGDMSLVGTRPPTVDEFRQYQAHHKSRLSFKPGITGLWQVSGRNSITDFEEIVELDNEYIRTWSLWLDIRILFKTAFVVLGRKGSM